MSNIFLKALLVSYVLLFSALGNSAAGQTSKAVKDCVSKRVADLRKDIGQDAVIIFSVLEEFERDCAANRPTEMVAGTYGVVQNNQSEKSSYSLMLWLIALGGIIFLMKSKFGSNLMESLREMESRNLQKKKEKQDEKSETTDGGK